MRVAISTAGTTLADPVDSRFGRTPQFLLVDSETGAYEVIDNAQNLQAAQGAGIQSAQTVARAGAGVVLTGHVGPKAFATLSAAGISVITGVSGSAENAFAAYMGGELTPTSTADVDGHW